MRRSQEKQNKMQRCTQKFAVVLALAAIALLAFTTTADLLPHHHDKVDERVCPICHPPLMGLRPIALRLPSLTDLSRAIVPASSISVHSPFLLRASSRAPPAA
jgi:hypothetical protein